MALPDGEYAGWVYRPPAPVEAEGCGAHWQQEEWSFWCGLPVAHNGPHQEAGHAEDRRYLVLWDDGPGHPNGERGGRRLPPA
jgi:hypothetical protein